MQVDAVEDIVADLRQGRMVVLVDDDADSSNEGVVMMAAEHVAPEHVNFMARRARGLICLTSPSRIDSNASLTHPPQSHTRPSSPRTSLRLSRPSNPSFHPIQSNLTVSLAVGTLPVPSWITRWKAPDG